VGRSRRRLRRRERVLQQPAVRARRLRQRNREDPNTICGLGSPQPWIVIGTSTTSSGSELTPPDSISDGSKTSAGNVNVTCTVSTSGNGFDISLNAQLLGLNGGSITITSPAGQGAVTSNGGSNITGVFQNGNDGTFREEDCTITFDYDGSPVPETPIAAGRIWGHLSCPTALDTGATVIGEDGGTEPRQCDGEADFLFQQCGQ
jgi:hypothetical protein